MGTKIFIFDIMRWNPAMLLAAKCGMGDHALGEQARKRRIEFHQLHIPHCLGDETGVKQVQNSVLDAANILINRQP